MWMLIAFVLGNLMGVVEMAILSGRLDRWLDLREKKMNNKKSR